MSDVAQVSGHAPESKPGGSAKMWALILGGTLLGLIIAIFMAVSVLPRWWSQRVGHQVDGDLTTGAFIGFVYGFFAMLLPILVLWAVWRFKRESLWAWLVGIGLAIVLAAPNWITLGITLGTGNAAHAADRTLDVNAPWYRAGTVVGVAVALVVLGFLAYMFVSRSRARKHAAEAHQHLEAEKRKGEEQASPADAQS